LVLFLSSVLFADQIKLQKLGQLKGHTGPVFSIAFSPNSKLLVSGGSASDSSVRIWNVSTFAQQSQLTGNAKQVAAVTFSSDGTKVLAAGYDHNIHVWDSSKGTKLNSINKSSDGAMISVDNLFTNFSADGSALAYSSDSSEGPMLFPVAEGKQVNLHGQVLPFDEGPGNVALNHNGTLVAAIGKGNVIHLIDSAGKKVVDLKSPEKADYSGLLAFSRNDAMLAVSNYDSSNIQLWNVQTKQVGPLLVGHKNNSDGMMMIMGLAFSPDGKLLASTSYDKTIRVWDTTTGKQIANVNVDGKGPSSLAWSTEGAFIASGDLDGSITIWGVR
jgi:WD40 repeat protein